MKRLRPASDGRRRPLLGLALLLGIAIVGTLWYWLVEGFGATNAAYQTVTTVTTVGFGEIEPLGARGRIFTMVLLLAGIGVALYVVVGVIEDLLERHLGMLGRRRMEHQIARLRGHVVLCGYGRVGREIVDIVGERETVVVIDHDEECRAAARERRLLTVDGDATEDEVLRRAGIERAATMIISVQSDADAISAVLSARVLNPELRIVARANTEHNEAKLCRAGADRVVNPLRIGASQLVSFARSPAVAEFVDLVGPAAGNDAEAFRLEEVVIPDGAETPGRCLGDLDVPGTTGALVLAMREPGGVFVANPPADAPLEPGATLILIGTASQLERLDRHFGRDHRA